MNTRKSKKGFTIVELVIVIAVIAILAAVLIPTFANLIRQANKSSDTQLVKNMNTILSAAEALNGKNETMADALQDILDAGYSVEKLTPTTEKCHIVWNQKTDRMIFLDENFEVEYPKDEKIDDTNDIWMVVGDKAALDAYQANYSIYLTEDFKEETVKVAHGLDVGSCKTIKTVECVNESYAGTILINMAGGNLTVNAPKATVNHYGDAALVEIEAVANASYHENGNVDEIRLKAGRVVVESKGNVAGVRIVADAISDGENGKKNVSVEVAAGGKLGAVGATNSTVAADLKNIVSGSTDVIESPVEVTNDFAGGFGTENSPYLIATVDELININNIKDTKGIFVRLTNSLVVPFDKLTKVQWTGYNYYTYCAVTTFNGVFDGAGYEIVLPDATNFSDNTSAAFATLINTSSLGIIKNIALTQGTLINNAHSVTAEKIITRGNLSFENNSGMIIGNAYDKATLIDCRNEANINSTSYSAVFVGYAVTKNLELAFTNCVNAGAYIGVKSSMFLGNVPGNDKKVKMIVTNCGNIENGLIRTTETASSYKWNSYVSIFANEKNINIVLNGETIGLERTLSSGFVQGPNDTLAISKNDDNTFNITKSNIDTVSYYVIKVYVYAKSINNDGGTQMFAVEEKISDNLKTTAKYLCFTTEKLTANGTICGWDVVTKNGEDYYSFNKEGYTVSNGTKPYVSIIAYDANGNVLSSATLSK